MDLYREDLKGGREPLPRNTSKHKENVGYIKHGARSDLENKEDPVTDLCVGQ